MSAFPADELRTPRTRLRRPIASDAAAIFARYGSDPEVARYVLWPAATDVSETEAFLQRSLDAWDLEMGHRPWIIEWEGRVAGMIGVTVTNRRAELGYVLARDCWGQGLMTEVVIRVMEHCFEDPTIDRVWAVADVDNTASSRVMEKAEMTFEGVLRAWAHHPGAGGGSRDCRCYSRVRGER
ncbi:MAG: GNAT family N-acetyltransferase [Myxococcota bacterium]